MFRFLLPATTALVVAVCSIGTIPTTHAQSASPVAVVASLSDPQPAQKRVEERIGQMHRELRITPAQQTQWEAFTGAMREEARGIDQIFASSGDLRSGTALDDMRFYAAITQAHADGVRRLVPAFTALYETMSPEQRRTADEVFHQYAVRQRARATAAR